MRVWVGVDAGGTKTRAVAVSEDGDIRADLATEGADLPSRGVIETEATLGSLREGIAAGLGPRDVVVGVTVGLPGFGEAPAWSSRLRDMCAAVFAPWPTHPENDVRLAFVAAFTGGPGVLILSGTGSMAWGESPSREAIRSGGWGPMFGDEGSAYAIGIAALRAASHALDGRGPATSLAEALPRALALPSLWEVLALLQADRTRTRLRTAGLATTVDAEALSGDEVALGILAGAAADLLAHVRAVMRALRLDATSTDVRYAGATFRSQHLRHRFVEEVRAVARREPTQASRAPVYGGLLLAGAERALIDAAASRDRS